MLTVLYLLAVFLVSFIISANNSANSVGTLYGSHITSYKKAAIYAGLFVFIGVILEGRKMSGTIGGGIVYQSLTFEMAIMVLFSTFILMLLFTYLSMPLSASQIIVGSVLGVAFSFGWLIHATFLGMIILSWVLTILFSSILAFVIYNLIALLARKLRFFALSKFYTVSIFVGSAFLAYTLGANTIGLVASLTPSLPSLLIAGIASFAGTILMGRKTVRTVGRKIILLDPPRAFAAQISGALIVEIFTQLHLPVPITQAVIGGIIGTGFVKGHTEINRDTIKHLAISWSLAPLLAFLLTSAIIKVSSLLL